MGVEQLAIPAIAAISNRPFLANALFGLTKWGNPFDDERYCYPYPLYDTMRADPSPISFGHGIHFCIGSALARFEARVALPKFLDAFGDYTIDLDNTRWKRSLTLRGPIVLPLRRSPATTASAV
jgi:hypothetical protein